jgi:hypothetical protein
MRDRAVIRHRLSQYSALWLGGFLLVLIAAAGASLVAGLDLVDVADLVLPIAFVLLGGAMAFGVGATAMSRAGLATKSLVTALGLVLLLPLLWAPVLAVLVVAAIGGGDRIFLRLCRLSDRRQPADLSAGLVVHREPAGHGGVGDLPGRGVGGGLRGVGGPGLESGARVSVRR